MSELDETAPSWAPMDAGEADRWALCDGDNWVTREDSERGAKLSSALSSLQRRVAELESEISEARAIGHAKGVEAGRLDVLRILAVLESERDGLAGRAATVAGELASGLVGDAVARDPAALKAWAKHALSMSGLDGDVVSIEVASTLRDSVGALLDPVPVIAALDLDPGDARVVMNAGKREFRLVDVFEDLRDAIAARLGEDG